jgi:hypothetical protein
MDPDLVSAAGVKLQTEQVNDLEPRGHEGVGPGGTTIGGDGHPLPVVLVPGDGGIDSDRAGIQVPPRQGGVGPLDPSRRDRRPKLAMGKVGLGDDHEP